MVAAQMTEVKASVTGSIYSVVRIGFKWGVEMEHAGREKAVAGLTFWRRKNAERLRDTLCRLADEAYWDTKALIRRKTNSKTYLPG